MRYQTVTKTKKRHRYKQVNDLQKKKKIENKSPQGPQWAASGMSQKRVQNLFLPEFPQGSLVHTGGLQSMTTVRSFVYQYGRKYSISKPHY